MQIQLAFFLSKRFVSKYKSRHRSLWKKTWRLFERLIHAWPRSLSLRAPLLGGTYLVTRIYDQLGRSKDQKVSAESWKWTNGTYSRITWSNNRDEHKSAGLSSRKNRLAWLKNISFQRSSRTPRWGRQNRRSWGFIRRDWKVQKVENWAWSFGW